MENEAEEGEGEESTWTECENSPVSSETADSPDYAYDGGGEGEDPAVADSQEAAA